MNKSIPLALALLLTGGGAMAQIAPKAVKKSPASTVTLKPPASAPLAAPTSTVLPTAKISADATPLPADHIVALVNSEPLTNNEVRARLARIESAASSQALPPRTELLRQVTERLIVERTQIQLAAETGIKVDDAAIAQAEETVARQNSLSVEGLRERLKSMGMDPSQFRNNLRQEITLQRVREREVDNRVKVSESDIDAYLASRLSSQDLSQIELNLAQVLIQVPENADDSTVERLRQRAEQVAQKARSGDSFAALAKEFSEAMERNNGGQLGLRNAERYPTLFVEATQTLPVGGIAGPVRSGAGFHILKVLEKRNASLPDAQYTQTRARHILLRPSVQLSQEAAIARLKDMRQQIATGKARFEDLARQYSQDGSASTGGDLGWASPGQFVPEFEQVMNNLAPSQMAEPLVSRFGVHLIQVQERRQQTMTTREQREWVRNVLREQKTEEAYENWVRDLRARAYVEYREPPQ